jgi:hypothetical protein
MDSEVFAKAKEIADKLAEPIDSAGLALDVARAGADKGKKFAPIADVGFQIEAGSEVAISVFNASNDADDLAMYGALATEGAPSGIAWRPLLQSTPDTVWLRYRANCHVKVGASASAGLAKFKVDSSAALAVATYMPHQKSQGRFPTLVGAVASDLTKLPHVFSHLHLKTLTADQVVAVELGGSLNLNIDLDWADVLTGLNDPIDGLALGQAALAPKIDASAKVRFALGLSGLYRVAFHGLPDGWIELQLLTNRRRQMDLGVELGLDIAFANPDAAEAVLPELAGELLGGDPQALANWKASIAELQADLKVAYDSLLAELTKPAHALERYLSRLQLESRLQRLQHIQQKVNEALAQTPVVDEAAAPLAEMLGLTIVEATKLIDGIQALPGKLKALGTEQAEKLWRAIGLTRVEERLGYVLNQLERLESIIKRVARAQLKLRFSYEYSRTEDNAALLSIKLASGKLPDVLLKQIHQAALSLDAASILQLASDHPKLMTDGLLLGHSISERRRSFGFTLGVDRWSVALNWLKTRKRVTLFRQVQGEQRQACHSLLGQRSYDGKGFSTFKQYAGEVLFGMPEYRAENGADGDWTAALGLRWTHTYPKLERRDLAEALDHAELWAAISDLQSSDVQQRLWQELSGKRIRARVELSLDSASIADERFKALLRGDLNPHWARALAGALLQAGRPERALLRERERLYAGVTDVLMQPRYIGLSALPEKVVSRIRWGLRNAGASRELIDWEMAKKAETTLGALHYQLRFDKGFLRSWSRMARALYQLASADDWSVSIGLDKGQEVIDMLDRSWDDHYSQRAFGRLMVLLHREAGLVSGLGAKLRLEELSKDETVVASRLVLG